MTSKPMSLAELFRQIEGESDRQYVFVEKDVDFDSTKFILVNDDDETQDDDSTGGYKIEAYGSFWIDFLEVSIIQDIKVSVEKNRPSAAEPDYRQALKHYAEFDSFFPDL